PRPCAVLFLTLQRPPRPTLFPYTTLFRSGHARRRRIRRRRTVAAGRLRHGHLAIRPDGREIGAAATSLSRRRLSSHTRGIRSSGDRKSTRLNSSHVKISYAVFCLKKKKET